MVANQKINVVNHLQLCVNPQKRVIPFRIAKRKIKCPVCGKLFYQKVDMLEPNPFMDAYCSKECRNIAHDKYYNDKVTEEEFIEFISKWDNYIQLIPFTVLRRCMQGKMVQAINGIAVEDLRQEILIRMFLFLSRNKKNPDKIKTVGLKYIKRICFNACFDAINESFESLKNTETAIWGDKLNKKQDENSTLGLDSLEYRTYSSEYTLDIYEILQEIKKLMEEVPVAKLAVEHALNLNQYESIKNTGKKHAAARGKGKYLQQKYNIKNVDMLSHYVQKGVECIYYNDPERIKSYIDIDNLYTKYRFNDENSRLMGKPFNELTKDEIIHFYKGERKCTVCGKYFKTKQFSSLNAACSPKCKRELLNATCRRQYHKHKEKFIERKKRYEQNKLNKSLAAVQPAVGESSEADS